MDDVQAFRRELKENLIDWLQLMDKTVLKMIDQMQNDNKGE